MSNQILFTAATLTNIEREKKCGSSKMKEAGISCDYQLSKKNTAN